MKRTIVILVLALAALVGRPAPARADATAFWGFSPTPASRKTGGFSVGINVIVLGFEFEYAHTAEQAETAAPSVSTGMINALVQTPTPHAQLYLTAGGGFFRETLAADAKTNIGTNIGGGVKIGLAGPIRVRIDYRVFSLHGARYTNPNRFYAGLNLAF